MDKLIQQQWQMHRYGAFVFQQMSYSSKTPNPIKKPTDLFELEIDKLQKGAKKELKFITVTRDGKD